MSDWNQYDFGQDDCLHELQKELGQQVSMELDGSTPLEPVIVETVVTKKKIPRGIMVAISLFLILGVSGVIYANSMMDRMNYESENDVKRVKEEGSVANAKEIDLPDASDFVGSDKNVINILLIGEEAMEADRGRSDATILATINQDEKSIKLTSFMRDCYVAIPGYRNNKLNAAYSLGGGPLLCETLQLNFNAQVDGYVRVNFKGFRSVIDKLGGVEITLTENEARYLNRTNYISKKKNRNVVPGKQILNGDQALGYSRIRYVKGITNEKDDYGRTSRQRILLEAIFDKYKKKNIVELAGLANDILPLMTTNMKKSDMISYLTTAVSLGTTELETFRVPVEHSFAPEDVYIGNSKCNVLIVDLNKNTQELTKFIYGEETE